MNRRKRSVAAVSDTLDTTSLPLPKDGTTDSLHSSNDVYLEFKSGNSSKFYKLNFSNCQVDIKYGKIGTDGVQSFKSFSTENDALYFVRKTAADKVKKGYVECSLKKVSDAEEMKEEIRVNNTEERVLDASDDIAVPSRKKKARTATEGLAKEKETENISSILYDGFSSSCSSSSSTFSNDVYLEFKSGNSSKFYQLNVSNCQVVIKYGKIGTDGVQSSKSFSTEKDALSFVRKTAAEKVKKGYVECSLRVPSVEEVIKTAQKEEMEEIGIEVKEDREAIDVISLNNDDSDHEGSVSDSPSVASAPATSETSVTRVYLECTENGSDKFYCMSLEGGTEWVVTLSYGRRGGNGTPSVKKFNTKEDAMVFVNKTKTEKIRKGYQEKSFDKSHLADSINEVRVVKDDPAAQLADLESGQKVFVQGSSALPYTCKKFDGGYSCTCQGWTMTVKNKGVQATTCKHLKSIRGDLVELERCNEKKGVCNPSSKDQRSYTIPGKISLAHPWKQSMDPTNYIMSEKLDGMRAYWTGKQLFTRSGLLILCPEWFTAAFPTALELDGELFCGRKQFDVCMSVTRRTDKGGDWTKISYVVFDAPMVKDGICGRLEAAAAAIEQAAAGKSEQERSAIRVHPFNICNGVQHLMEDLANVEAVGGEGLMLRHPTARHRAGRTNDLLKVKNFQDDEALVTGYEAGKGKYEGRVGSLVCVARSGARFKVGSGLSDALRSYSSAPPVGTVITFKFFELSPDGVPRFPTYLRIRPDVPASEFPKI